jgi:hypothetical protein
MSHYTNIQERKVISMNQTNIQERKVIFYELPGNRVFENQITMRSRPRWPFKSQNFKPATQFVIYTYDTIAMKEKNVQIPNNILFFSI